MAENNPKCLNEDLVGYVLSMTFQLHLFFYLAYRGPKLCVNNIDIFNFNTNSAGLITFFSNVLWTFLQQLA